MTDPKANSPTQTTPSTPTSTQPTAPSSGPVSGKAPFAPKHKRTMPERFARWVLVIFTLFVLLSAGYTWATLHYTYSEGERVGYARKISHKGWLCKTWEGEISLSNTPGSQEAVFEYTVPEQAVVDKIRALEGKRVVILYKERKGIPSSCFGDTLYHAYDVREVK